jgi:hypothetical protein
MGKKAQKLETWPDNILNHICLAGHHYNNFINNPLLLSSYFYPGSLTIRLPYQLGFALVIHNIKTAPTSVNDNNLHMQYHMMGSCDSCHNTRGSQKVLGNPLLTGNER